MAAVALLTWLPAIAFVSLLFGIVILQLMIRAQSMQALATRYGYRYVGPRAPSFLGFYDFGKVQPLVPLPHACHQAEIRQAWNMIMGQQNGVSILIFDSALGGRRYCTFIAWQSDQNPFDEDNLPDRVIQSSGWTVLFRSSWFQIIPWTMSIERLDEHLNKLRFGLV
jgi:hypothetical protein